MGILEINNLGYGGPAGSTVQNRLFHGASDFLRYLKATKKYLDENKVFRATWAEGQAPTRRRARVRRGDPKSIRDAVWVELLDAPGASEQTGAELEEFFQDNVKYVYELPEAIALLANGAPRRPGREYQIKVLGHDRDTNQLALERLPDHGTLASFPNTIGLKRQLDAIEQLRDMPDPAHRPLVQLFEDINRIQWPAFEPSLLSDSDWLVLTDPTRPGTLRQREFVAKALATPDFAILEGPPGSGKTTAICELVLQTVRRRGGRVLLCASTHVAVDNVLERIMDPDSENGRWINPLRIGDAGDAKDTVAGFLWEERRRSDIKHIRHHLSHRADSRAAQQLGRCLDSKQSLHRLLLDTSNLICGTTIGIMRLLGLVDDRRAFGPGSFDMLIIDEASKTTFAEFLVPALLARRWVLVGDPKQLSPYVDVDALEVNLAACLPSTLHGESAVDVFLAHPDRQRARKQRRTLVVDPAGTKTPTYARQAEARGVELLPLPGAAWRDIAAADVLLISDSDVDSHVARLPLDLATIRSDGAISPTIERRADAFRSRSLHGADPLPTWQSEFAHRLVSYYEQRFSPAIDPGSPTDTDTPSQRAEQLRLELDQLCPALSEAEQPWRLETAIGAVRRVALPSILEALRLGFERSSESHGSTLTDGFPTAALRDRHVLLDHQHRMHPDIAAFPSRAVYGGDALITHPTMAARRSWSFDQGKPRVRWTDMPRRARFRTSEAEASEAIRECKRFAKWAEQNPRPPSEIAGDSGPWSVAMLTFYRSQERVLRDALRRWTGQHRARRFYLPNADAPTAVIELCTVDRFQGQEADLVVLSIANDHSTVFLESLNRLNVALTRARYQLIIIGDKRAMSRRRSAGTLMHTLATSPLVRSGDLIVSEGSS
ncbi:MAG: AAA family ATPase [Polyangiaceae bacterium]|nr:AAA family ATPase [Polyangiaceae bacterium]